ncbi:SDR family NAD(P)-dependent oxidoreductase [Nocardia sp. CA-128927]|uniref:SDR family NAD(P)-dependent oxidoreductase n=1 Tax=Nocardia sp. CA-128927 TaxID=3239975 RepID=UPI003D956332
MSGTFVVVGAGPGLGSAAARRFGHEGHPVGLIARSAGNLDKIAADLIAEGITAATESADVTDENALTVALGALRERLGPIEVVLFSPRPSLGWIKPVLDTAPSDIDSALALSVVGSVPSRVPSVSGTPWRGLLAFRRSHVPLTDRPNRRLGGLARSPLPASSSR